MAGYGCATKALFASLLWCLLSQSAMAESSTALWSNRTISSSSNTVSESSTLSFISSTKSTTTSDDIGAFVAAGMGMTRTRTSTVTETISTSSTSSSTSDAFTQSDASAPAITAAPTGNYTLSFTGNCWQQWSSYWAANSSITGAFTYTTIPATNTYTLTRYWYSFTSSAISESTTVTVYNGAHPQDTYTTFAAVSTWITGTSEPTATSTNTVTRLGGSRIDLFGNGTLIEPTCTLPSYVPECQEMWEDWIYHKYASEARPEKPVGCSSNVYKSVQAPSCSAPVASYISAEDKAISLAIRDTPTCTQASVTGEPCSTLFSSGFQRNARQWGHYTDGRVGGGFNWTTYTTTTGTHEDDVATVTSVSYFWDPSSELAPGCTLGCQSCQVNGGTVQLIYWPPASSTWIDGKYTAITANATGPVTMETLGTTLTSPTVYVSFDSLYARDSCSSFGKTHYDQIVAITDTANLSSIYGWGRYNGIGYTASFNFTDL